MTRPEDPASAAASDVQEPSLGRSALGGIVWNSAGSVVLVIAQIASTAATARLVAPREFGVYATAQAATGLAGYFTMAALGGGIQRRTHLGEGTVGTALILSLASSLIVGGALFLGAGMWARAWGVPEAESTVRLIAVALVITSAAVVPIALIRRQLHFRSAAIIETASQVVAMGGGVAFAARSHSAQALAIGQIAGAGVLLSAAVAAAKRELRPGFDRDDARELLTFSSQVNGLGLFAYLTISAPSWFVARSFGAFDLGIYSRAFMIVGIPATYAMTSIFKVLYPLYGRVREDLARTRTLLEEALALTTGMAWPLFALLAGAAPVIVSTLLGPRWDAASPLLPLFALAACAYIPCGLLTNGAEAMGWMRIIAMREVVFLAGTATGLAAVYFMHLGLNWVLVTVAAAQGGAYALTLEPFIRRGVLDARLVLRVHLVHGAMALTAFGMSALCAELLGGAALLVQLAGQAAVGAVVLATIVHGRSWMPATQVLARRIGVASDESIVRGGLGALR